MYIRTDVFLPGAYVELGYYAMVLAVIDKVQGWVHKFKLKSSREEKNVSHRCVDWGDRLYVEFLKQIDTYN